MRRWSVTARVTGTRTWRRHGARKAIIEPVFAQLKWNQGFRRFTVRGLEKVNAQWALLCTAFNLKKLYAAWKAGTFQLKVAVAVAVAVAVTAAG